MIETRPGTSHQAVPVRTLVVRLVAGVLLVNLFIAGLTGISLYRSRQQYENRVAVQTQNLSQSLSLTIAGIIDKADIAMLSVKSEVERQLAKGAMDGRALNAYIRVQKEHVPELDGLRTTDASGLYVHGDGVVSGSTVRIDDRDYFDRARTDPKADLIISKPLFARSSQKWVVNIVRRIDNPDGSFAGIVSGAISLDYLSRLFSSFDLGRNGVITLRARDLAVVTRYPEAPGGGTTSGSTAVSRELQALVRAEKDSGTYRTSGSIDPIERTFSFHRVSHYPLFVNVGLATSEYLASWRMEVRQTLALVALFAAGTVLSVWSIYRNRMRERLAAAELAYYHEHLEETVRERTAELESKNDRLADEVVLRRQVEADLRKAAVIMDRMPDAVNWVDKDGRYLYVNDAACAMHGYTREELLSMTTSEVALHFPASAWQRHWEELKRAGQLHFETINRSRDGREFPVDVSANHVTIDGVEYNCAIIRDTSDRKEAEAEKQRLMEQLNQSRKIESIGRLAGGIAHDFNNLLTPILGYGELIKAHLAPGSRDGAGIDAIILAAGKAKALTQQLLSFGRKQILEMQTVDMNGVIRSLYGILRRTIRESIDIQMHLADDGYGIRADRNQLEQVIMNLVINAQDAITGNGVITMETAPVTLDAEYARQHADVVPGNHLMLAVTDTGSGMDQQTLDHIFEPFFTTKAVGEGSGLGLATVYGLVKQHEGHVWVYSEVGKGTVFKIYFPLSNDTPAMEPDNGPQPSVVAIADRTILLVEDNEMVRDLVRDLLDACRCRVLAAERPEQALAMGAGQRIDLLLTDVVMPGMNGPELYRKLLPDHGDLHVLYMSGYTNNVILHHGVLDEGVNFIQKPFTVSDLAHKINAILNSPHADGRGA